MRTTFWAIVLLGTILILGACSKEENEVPTAVEKQTPEAPMEMPAKSTEAVRGEYDITEGQAVYTKACSACHDTGIAGAPKFGDKERWESRIAQGMDTLIAHSINGYQGQSGVMPAKGGNTSLTKDEVAAAVAYMVENSR